MRANFRADLVRNELLYRNDLMKMYHPPLKISQLPTNNPFYTKSIVGKELKGGDSVSAYPIKNEIGKE